MHKINPNFESDVKMTSVVRRLEALEMSKGVQSSTLEPSKPVVSLICVLCDSQDYMVEQCPGLPIINAEQANILNIYRKPNPNNNPFSETYNSGWRNHPKLSWKSSQGQGYGGSPSSQRPPPNNQFHKRNQYAATSSAPPYVRPNQRKLSLENILSQFIQSQALTKQNQIQHNHTTSQAIAKIEI